MLHNEMNVARTVASMTVEVSTDNGSTWNSLTSAATGHWSVSGLTGLAAGGTVKVRVVIDGEQKTTDGTAAVAGTNDFRDIYRCRRKCNIQMKQKTLSIITAVLLAGLPPFSQSISFAASCCGGGSAASLTVPKYAAAVADLSFDTEIYDGYWNQSRKYIADPPGSDLKQYRLNMGLGYRLARDWQASVSLPYVWNDNSYSGVSSQTSGLGDIRQFP